MALIGSWVKLMEGVCRQIIPGTIGLIEDPLREEGRQSRLPPWTSGISRSAHEKKSTAQAADAALLVPCLRWGSWTSTSAGKSGLLGGGHVLKDDPTLHEICRSIAADIFEQQFLTTE